MESDSVTCHPTQVNAPALTQPDRPILDLPTLEGWKAELTLVAYQNSLPVHRESPIQIEYQPFDSNTTEKCTHKQSTANSIICQ